MPKAPRLLSIRLRGPSIPHLQARSFPILLHHSRTKNKSLHPHSNPHHHQPHHLTNLHHIQTYTATTSKPLPMSTNPQHNSTIFLFYDPNIQASDSSGRTLSSILALPDTSLEFCHDYIQQLFPLPETSSFHPSSPTIDEATFTAFRSRPELRDRLADSLTRMLHFYGFEPSSSSSQRQQAGEPNPNLNLVEIVRGANYDRASRNWVKRFDHNHLRMTRIIRSLRVLGLETHARCLFRALVSVYDHGRSGISARSVIFWTRAAERPLYLAPEDERDQGQGKVFLYEYEASRRAEADGDAAAVTARNGNGQGTKGAGEKDGPD